MSKRYLPPHLTQAQCREYARIINAAIGVALSKVCDQAVLDGSNIEHARSAALLAGYRTCARLMWPPDGNEPPVDTVRAEARIICNRALPGSIPVALCQRTRNHEGECLGESDDWPVTGEVLY